MLAIPAVSLLLLLGPPPVPPAPTTWTEVQVSPGMIQAWALPCVAGDPRREPENASVRISIEARPGEDGSLVLEGILHIAGDDDGPVFEVPLKKTISLANLAAPGCRLVGIRRGSGRLDASVACCPSRVERHYGRGLVLSADCQSAPRASSSGATSGSGRSCSASPAPGTGRAWSLVRTDRAGPPFRRRPLRRVPTRWRPGSSRACRGRTVRCHRSRRS